MVVAAEGARAHVRLTARFAKTPRSMVVPVKRMAACTAAIKFSTSRNSAVHVVCNAALTAPAVVVAAIVKCVGMRVVAVMVVDRVVVVPVESPISPSPSETAEPANAEANSKGQVRTAEPYAGIVVPIGPGRYGISVNEPGVVGWNIDHIRLSRLNHNIVVLILYHLLRCRLQIAGCFRFSAHALNSVHHVLLLVVVSVAQRRGPGNIFVHISQHSRESAECFHTGIPRLLIDSLG